MLPNDVPCGGLDTYWRGVTWTNCVGWKWERSLNILESINALSHQYMVGERWHVTLGIVWKPIKGEWLLQISFGENGRKHRNYQYGRSRQYIYLWSHLFFVNVPCWGILHSLNGFYDLLCKLFPNMSELSLYNNAGIHHIIIVIISCAILWYIMMLCDDLDI